MRASAHACVPDQIQTAGETLIRKQDKRPTALLKVRLPDVRSQSAYVRAHEDEYRPFLDECADDTAEAAARCAETQKEMGH